MLENSATHIAIIPGGDIKIRLAFPTSAMFSHDCLPNVVRHIGRKKDGFQLKGYAARNIKKGEKLSISYVDLLLPTIIRQEILRKVSTLTDRNGILLPKMFSPTVRKICSSDREKLLKFSIYSNSERSEEFLVSNRMLF